MPLYCSTKCVREARVCLFSNESMFIIGKTCLHLKDHIKNLL